MAFSLQASTATTLSLSGSKSMLQPLPEGPSCDVRPTCTLLDALFNTLDWSSPQATLAQGGMIDAKRSFGFIRQEEDKLVDS